jgi:hypothetical protein
MRILEFGNPNVFDREAKSGFWLVLIEGKITYLPIKHHHFTHRSALFGYFQICSLGIEAREVAAGK